MNIFIKGDLAEELLLGGATFVTRLMKSLDLSWSKQLEILLCHSPIALEYSLDHVQILVLLTLRPL